MESFFDNLFDDIFSKQELETYDHIYSGTMDVEALKKTGVVDITKTTDRGLVSEVLTYNSFDGKVSFSRTKSYYEAHESYEKIKTINQLIKNAIEKENYEKALLLKQEKESLLAKLN